MAWVLINELWRKAIHITILIILLAYNSIQNNYSKQLGLLFIVALLVVLLIIEYLRLELGVRMPLLLLFIRPKEEHRLTGSVYFLVATIIALGVFDFRIALAALFMTTFGDLTASLVGKTLGKSLIYRSKTWAGFFAEFIVNLIVGFIVLNNIYVIIGMAIVATFSEILVEEIDDNLVIPLFSGFVGQLIRFIL